MRDEPERSLAQRRDPERPVAAAAAGIVAALGLLSHAGELFHRIVALANRGSELLAEPLGRLAEVVAALGCGLGERRIRKMSPVANAGPVFLESEFGVRDRPAI